MAIETPVALVTGGSGALGQAISLRLARAGFAVAVQFHSASGTASEVVAAIGRLGGEAIAVQADVGLADDAHHLVSEVVERLNRLDVVVNGAGIIRDCLLVEMTDEQVDDVLRVNLRSVFCVSRAAARHMMIRRQGAIINLSSAAATSPRRGHTNYVAAKAGLEGFTRAAAIEFGAKGIRVNAVAPGIIESPMTAEIRSRDNGLKNRIVLRRFGVPEDVANAVAFLASGDASYITGQILRVDGGGQSMR